MDLGVCIVSGEIEPPGGEILDRQHADDRTEPLGKRRARQAASLRKFLDRPRIGRLSMKKGHRAGQIGIAQASEPARLLLRKRFSIGRDRFDEKQFRKLGHEGLRSHARGRYFGGGMTEGASNPIGGAALSGVEPENGGKRIDNRVSAKRFSAKNPQTIRVA